MHGLKWGWGLTLVLACGGGGGGDGTGGQTEGTGSDTSADTGGQPTTSAGEASQSGTSTGGGVSESQTGETTAVGETTMGATLTEPGTTTSTTVTTVETTVETSNETTSVETADTGTTASSVGETGTTTAGDDTTSVGEGSTTDPCVPAEEVCNKLDDDCDDIIDDVDVGMDGICDCLSIALVGNQGANPSSEFQTWLQDQGTTVVRINSNVMNDIDVPLTPAVLANYDILIIDYLQRSYTVQEAADVRGWIEAGGGLMSMTGHVGSQVLADRDNSLLSAIGLTYNTSSGFFSGPITQFNPHPITMGLTSITFLGGLFVDIVDDGVGVNQVIMTLPPGPVGVVQERLEGRAFVFGDEWVEFDSEWQNMAEIKQFWVQTLAWIGPQDFCLLPQ